MSLADDIRADSTPDTTDAPPSLADSIRADAQKAAPAPPAQSASLLGTIKQGAGNVAAGAVRGAGSIGATILYPWDKYQDLTDPNTKLSNLVSGKAPLTHNEQRRADMDAALKTMGADPSSLAFQGGKLGGEVAGTAGIGGVLGAGAKALGAAPEVVSALSSGGMSLGGGTTGSVAGNAALRTGAGAATGALTAGAVDPSTAGTGAAIGAATPGAAWLLGLAGKGLGKVVGGTAKTVLGGTTGTGADVVGAAYQAGAKGDSTFLDNARGNANFGDIVDQAKEALANMRAQRSADYTQGMAAVSGDKTVLDLQPIQKAVADAQSKFAQFNGQVVNENANSAIQRVSDKVNEWSQLDPATFHTPEGLDKLKQWVGGELENAKPGTQTEAALKGIYSSIKSSVAAQAPTYAKTMQAYSDASEQLSEITKSLSLGNKTSVDTAVRKLQSVLRNNVNTNFGNRAGSVSALEQQGGANLVPAIAGQSMSSWFPRGVTGAVDAAALVPAAIHNPALLASGLAASPRLVGEAAYKAGQLSSLMKSGAANAGQYAPVQTIAPLLGTQQPATLNDLLNQLNGVRRKNSP
jgi:hypothetical protein